jgi:hypothetical protein
MRLVSCGIGPGSSKLCAAQQVVTPGYDLQLCSANTLLQLKNTDRFTIQGLIW